MDFKSLVLHHANELAIPVDDGLELVTALEPLCVSLGEVMDLGIYFHSATRCEAECNRHGLPVECSVLLWAVCASLRDRLEGQEHRRGREGHRAQEPRRGVPRLGGNFFFCGVLGTMRKAGFAKVVIERKRLDESRP